MVTGELTSYDTKVFTYADGYQIRRYRRPVRRMTEGERERRRRKKEREAMLETAWKNSVMIADDLAASQIELDDYLRELTHGDVKLDNLRNESVTLPKKDDSRSLQVSVNRSVNHVYQLARANRWEYFFTLTFNPAKVDSSDYSLTVKKFSQWLNNMKKTHSPDMRYLFVPELHKDGKKYHFHGLVTDIGTLPLAPSGYVTKSGSMIYNLPSYSLGFSTATEIRDSAKACSYVVKYLTKELFCTSRNRKRYWASRNLAKPGEDVFQFSTEEFKAILSDDYNASRLASQKTFDLFVDSMDTKGKPYNKISYFEFND